MEKFTHIDEKGHVRMVDVSEKNISSRQAIAKAKIQMNISTIKMIINNEFKKGNVLETSRIAGIMAAKKTSELIPLCHPLNIEHIQIDFITDLENSIIEIESNVRISGKTGVEMEALTSASIAALTIYDMCKSIDKKMTIKEIKLIKKTGGKSGTFLNY